MSLQPQRPLLDTLRDVLRKMEQDATTDTPRLAELKRIIRERIAAIESTQRLTAVATHQRQDTPRKTIDIRE
jgi:hypothetical protein